MTGLRGVRRPVWLAALAALITATLVLSAGHHGPAPAAHPAGDAPASAAPRGGGPPAPSPDAPGSADAKNGDETDAAGAPAVDEAALHAAIAGDDPVAAAFSLLRLRAECLRTRSEPCLRGVDQPDSVALAADLAELRSRPHHTPAGGLSDRPVGDVPFSGMTLVEQFGGTAIVAVPPALLGEATPDTPPASLLLIRSEAGWRIRDVL